MESTAEWKTTYQGKTYYFCAASCLKSFEQEPGKYTATPGAGQSGPHHQPEHGHEHGQH